MLLPFTRESGSDTDREEALQYAGPEPGMQRLVPSQSFSRTSLKISRRVRFDTRRLCSGRCSDADEIRSGDECVVAKETLRAGSECGPGKETLRADDECEIEEATRRVDDGGESANDTVRELLRVRSTGSEV